MSKIDFSQAITAEDQAAADAARQAEAEARATLADTDWYLIRRMETGAVVPKAVAEARAAARAVLSAEKD